MQNTVTLQASRNRSPLAQVLRNLGKEKTTLIGLAVVLLFVAIALSAPLLAPYEPLAQNIPASLAPPSPEHWFGADKLGRDIFSRMIYGARISLFVGFGVVLMASSFGTLVGMLAGYLGGWWDEALMRVTDIFFAFPSLILAMAIAGALGPSLQNALIAVAVVTWPIYARLVRGQVLTLRNQDFVLAAKLMGANNGRIIFRHLVPASIGHIIVVATLAMPGMILAETALSFLGLGLQPPITSWGVLIKEVQNLQSIAIYPWVFSPVIFIVVAILAFNFLGDGLRDAADPYTR